MKQLSLDAFLSYKFLSSLQFAPGGKQAAFVVSQCDKEENGYTSNIYLLKDEVSSKLTGLGQERTFVWEDKTHILFPAVRSKAEQKRAEAGDPTTVIYRISTEGGEAEPAFELPMPVLSMKRANDHTWLVTGGIDATHPDVYKMNKDEREAYLKEQKEGADYEVLTEIPFYFNGGGYIDKKRTALFTYDTETKAIRRVSGALCDVQQVIVQGDDVYYLASKKVDKSYFGDGDIYHFTLPDGDPVQVTHGEKAISGIEFLNGKLIAAAVEVDEYKMNDDEDFYWVDPESGDYILLAENHHSLGNTTGSDCRYGHGRPMKATEDGLYIVMTIRNAAHLYKLTGDGVMTPVITKEGAIDDFDVAEDGSILLNGMYDNKLEEIYAYDGGLKQVSTLNEEVLKDVYVADYQKLTVQSQGWDIDGWVLLPKDYDESKTYPAIIDIHGGPRTVYGEIFYHEMQYWANKGYFVFFCNPVGGSGRGLEFADITGKYGYIDYENIMDFTDAVLEKYPQIDPKRIGCTGGSYGGFMSNWILGHTDRFAAIATQRSISNWVSFYGVSDIGFGFGKSQMGADIYSQEGIEALWEHSPLKYADQMKTPTLLIHSFEDYRCPMEQGMQLFTALKERGVPARMVCFKGENHELSRSGKPLHRVRRLTEITNWMDNYTKGGCNHE